MFGLESVCSKIPKRNQSILGLIKSFLNLEKYCTMTEALIKPKSRKTYEKSKVVSLETYFRLEEQSLHKNEYHNGIIKPMAGALYSHTRLAQKIATLIDMFMEDKDYEFIVTNSDTKVRIENYDKVVYPDAVVVSEKPEFYKTRKDTIINPLLIVEVLSKSTADYDKGTKFEMYRSLPSFEEYVLVHQVQKQITVYAKQADTSWVVRDYFDDESNAILHSLHQCPISLKRLYKGIEM